MPIVGISDKIRFQRGGKIRLGEKVAAYNGKRRPSKTEYMIFAPDDPDYIGALHEKYGDRPKVLPIAFVSDDEEEVFPHYYKLYSKGSGLLCKGDGEVAHRVQEGSVDYEETACPGPENCKYALSKGNGKSACGRHASLQFRLRNEDSLFVWQINTTSINSILNVNGAIKMIRQLCGQIAGVPLLLRLVPREIIIPDTKKKSLAYVLQLSTDPTAKGVNGDLLALEHVEAPLPSEEIDDLLVPDCEVDDDGVIAEAEVVTDTLRDDPEVQEAMASSGFTPAKQGALYSSAESGNWPKEQLLKIIGTNQKQAAQSTNVQQPKKQAAPTRAPIEVDAVPAGNPGDLF